MCTENKNTMGEENLAETLTPENPNAEEDRAKADQKSKKNKKNKKDRQIGRKIKEGFRKLIASTGFRYGGYSTVVVVVVLVILVAINLIAGQLPSKFMHIDTSNTGYYSIGETTKKVVGELDDDITIYILSTEENADAVTVELIQRYQDMSDHIKFEYVNVAANPSFAAGYNASDASSGSLIVVGPERSTVVDYSDIYVTEVDYEAYYTTGEYSSTTSFDGEGQLTSAIDYVTSDSLPTLYTLTGHGESDMSDSITSEVTKINLDIQSLNLMTEESIPEDAGVILINAPTKDITEEEEEALQSYMDEGGSVIYIASLLPDEEMTNMGTLLAHYGMSMTNSLIIEGDSNYYYQYPYYLMPEVDSYSEITSPLADSGYGVLLLQSQGINVSSDLRDSVTVKSLLTTTDSSYGKVLENGQLSTYEKESGDQTGPFTLAATATETIDDEHTARLVVIASDQLLNTNVISQLPVGNLDVFLNALSWSCEHESTIAIASKDMSLTTLVVPSGTSYMYMFVMMFLIPVGLIVCGIVVWMKRRRL